MKINVLTTDALPLEFYSDINEIMLFTSNFRVSNKVGKKNFNPS